MNIKNIFKPRFIMEHEKDELGRAMEKHRVSAGGVAGGVGYYDPLTGAGRAISMGNALRPYPQGYPQPAAPPKPDPTFTLTVTKVENGHMLNVSGLGDEPRSYIAADLDSIQRIVAQLVGEKGLEMAG